MPLAPPRPRLPSLNALRAFEAAARCGSFTKAAEELGVTAGAVTQQIRQLEAALGMKLFDRLAQGVALTPAARTALPRLSRGFDMLAHSVQDLRAAHDSRALAIAALPCIAQLWLSPRLSALQQAFPGLQVSITAMEQPPDIRREPYDLALFYLDEAPVSALALGPDAILPVCVPAIAARLKAAADLAGETLLHDAVWRGDWARWLDSAGARKVVDASRGPAFSLYSLALDAALSGNGVLMGRLSLVQAYLADGRLIAPLGPTLALPDRLTLLAPPDGASHPKAQAVMEWLRDSAEVTA
ncbi:LysR family transcriptional regulator [Bosea caraganae]|uniref:LysR family transcriptional regulator n=1 Tax=Bosea caraganae TaxID=2763117 RepID=A0A370LBX0_9HYPH|nr:LysR substrate-binding domain-containing protein [Bosea caraganae]RDJ27456.1 LysR family transcriptional regulator [Bosea caraganae]RDJ29472.1 LysR family transcriptional regulator [Bosea caraganae]